MDDYKLNSAKEPERIKELKKISRTLKLKDLSDEVNNHIHTAFSFSPYSPAMAAYKAFSAGLQAAGIIDHDTVSGCREFLKACKILGIGSTAGFEIRVNTENTILKKRKINNPDTPGILYMAVHGIPYNKLKYSDRFLNKIRAARNKRNIRMVDKLNSIFLKKDLERIDFKKDVYDFSMARYGGSITERHIIFALVKKIIKKTGKGSGLINFVSGKLGIDITGKAKEYLEDSQNPYYEYDLLGVLKSSFLKKIYIHPDNDECISVFDAVKFADSINAVPAYAYLGDVGDSPTGDKKAQKFEDSYLEKLMPELKRIGFKGITYMPPRNTIKQLLRIKKYCKEFGFMEISGVDINSARQSFNCPEIRKPEFENLINTTWALIAHEKLAGINSDYALFGKNNPYKNLSLNQRIELYSGIGRKIDNRYPQKLKNLIKELKTVSRRNT